MMLRSTLLPKFYLCISPIDASLKTLGLIRNGDVKPTLSQVEYLKALYDQEIYSTDKAFGDLLEKLKGLGLYEDMVVVFTADHGEEFFDHGGTDHGLTLYNEQIRVPLILNL